MTQVHLLFANKTYDTAKQTVEKNQVIQMNGYDDDRYVVYDIVKTKWGLSYELINLQTHKFGQCDLIRPLSEKFGIGYYFDDENPRFMDTFEVAVLKGEAEQNKQAEQDAKQQEQERKEQLKTVGRQRLEELLPDDAKAIIIASLHKNESDPMTDYYGFSTERTVILGFSSHTKNDFSEMRKCASNFEETKHLSEKCPDYENRENYTGGFGYYLGESKYSGWVIKKQQLYGERKQFIEQYALIAGDENNICISATSAAEKADHKTVTGDFIIVDYSEKAIALFGDTKPIKDQLMILGGRFNPRLTHEDEKKAGWIFPKSKEQELRNSLTIK